MDETLLRLRINPDRLRADFDALAEIGATGDGGVDRPALSEAHLAARAWLRQRIASAGLALRVDGAGNHSAVLVCGPAEAPPLLLGSHLDSVPHGGRFDGALGVVAALEVLRVVQEAGVSLARPLEAIDFTDEEGTLISHLGSLALAGKLTPEKVRRPRSGREAFGAGLVRAGLDEDGLLVAGHRASPPAGYLELHVEQGRTLTHAGVDIGIVTGIAGLASYWLTFVGRADHAGAISMSDRLDGAQGASAFTLATRQIALDDFPGCVTNVGQMRFEPGAFNTVPACVAVALQFRAPTQEAFERLEAALLDRAEREAARFGLALHVEPAGRYNPTPMDGTFQPAIAAACDVLGLSHMRLTSGAGHDAQSLAGLCPVGMIFVPSVGGESHTPREFTEWQDCVNGAEVLLQTALRVAGA